MPAEIEESAAALQDLAGQFAPPGERRSASAQVGELKAMEAGRGCAIQCIPNGPYVVTNVEHLKNSKGEEIPARPQMALCRCGGSSNKPFCDGSHWYSHFEDDKN